MAHYLLTRRNNDWPKWTGEGPLSAASHLEAMIRADPKRIEDMLEAPAGIDPALWQYEHVRQLIVGLN